MKKLILIMFGILFLSGCSTTTAFDWFEQKTVKVNHIKNPDKFALASYPSELRSAYYNKERYCAEPFPDIGVNEQSRLNFPNKVVVVATSTISELTGRDSIVLLTREMLYRICEMGINNFETDTASRTMILYTKTLETIVQLADAEKVKAQAQQLLAKAKQDPKAQQLDAVAAVIKELKSETLNNTGRNIFMQKIGDFIK